MPLFEPPVLLFLSELLLAWLLTEAVESRVGNMAKLISESSLRSIPRKEDWDETLDTEEVLALVVVALPLPLLESVAVG